MSSARRRRCFGPASAVLLALACTPTSRGLEAPAKGSDATPTPAADATAAEPDAAPTLGPGAWHVGQLSQRGEPDCGSGKEQWVDVRPVIGWISTNELSDEESKWLDLPVVAHGKWTDAPSQPATKIVAECPPPQARSDWRFTPRGLRIERGGGSSGGTHLERDYLQPLVDLKVSGSGDDLVVDFRNPVPVALEGVVIRVHYEGCMGKPGTMSRAHEVGKLDVRAGTQARLPRLIARDGAITATNPADHAARSVQIEAQGVDVTFDLDVPLAKLGAGVDCPDR